MCFVLFCQRAILCSAADPSFNTARQTRHLLSEHRLVLCHCEALHQSVLLSRRKRVGASLELCLDCKQRLCRCCPLSVCLLVPALPLRMCLSLCALPFFCLVHIIIHFAYHPPRSSLSSLSITTSSPLLSSSPFIPTYPHRTWL